MLSTQPKTPVTSSSLLPDYLAVILSLASCSSESSLPGTVMCAARSDFLADYLVGVQPSRRTLGKGGFAYVLQGKWQGREVAVKYLHNIHMYPDEGAEDDQPSKAYYRFVDEFRTLRDLNHECLVQVYGVSPPPSTRDSHGLVMECLPITLRKRYSNTPHFAIHQEVTVACDVCRGLEYLHAVVFFTVTLQQVTSC